MKTTLKINLSLLTILLMVKPIGATPKDSSKSQAPAVKAKSVKVSKKETKSALKRLDQRVMKASKKLFNALNKELKIEGVSFTTLAVLPFKSLDNGAKDADVDAALAELFSTRMSSRDQIIAVERSRINSVISELKRANTGQLSPKGAAQAGKLLGARYVLVGSITTMGQALQVTTRLVASETGEVISGEIVRAPRKEFVKFQQEVVIPKSKIGAAIRSFLIPGWGQLYNDAKLTGYSTIIAGLSTVGTAALYGYLGTMAEAEYQENKADTVGRRTDANRYYRNARIALWSYAAIWSFAIFDAYVSGTSNSKIDLNAWSDLESTGLIFSGTF